MDLTVLDITSATQDNGTIAVSDKVFNEHYNESLIHQVATAYMAGARSGSKAQKNRAAVRGGGRKPHSQKGSGRARAGTIRSPIWRGGGVTFAAKPKDYSKKVNKKMYRVAMRAIFSELLRSERLKVIRAIDLEKPSTKSALGLLKKLSLEDVLFITELFDKNLYLSTRNLYHAAAIDVAAVNPISLIGFKHTVLTESALKKIDSWLAA